MPHPFKLGNTTILVHNDFADGYANGFITHPQAQQGEPISLEMISELVAECFLDVSHTHDWNVGYLVGAIEGIRLGNSRREEAVLSSVRLGAATLRLNRWRFREGYYNGQEYYQAGQDEQSLPLILTARGLLSYIAHHDSKTDTYFLSENELNTLEETLGQLIGYVCAALFPFAEQGEREKTMSLPTKLVSIASLQEA